MYHYNMHKKFQNLKWHYSVQNVSSAPHFWFCGWGSGTGVLKVMELSGLWRDGMWNIWIGETIDAVKRSKNEESRSKTPSETFKVVVVFDQHGGPDLHLIHVTRAIVKGIGCIRRTTCTGLKQGQDYITHTRYNSKSKRSDNRRNQE